MPDGSCLLASENLSEFVVHPFTPYAYFDFDKFNEATREGVIALNEVLDEGLELHPLQGQRDNARDWRQIGLGLMGIADMFIKLGIEYGSEESIQLLDKIGLEFANSAIKQSALLSKKYGPFPKYDKEATLQSEWLLSNCYSDTLALVAEYGLRNSQLLTIAPTGSISTMWGISGGGEPIFAVSFKRKTESIHGTDVYYDVYTPIVKEAMDTLNMTTPPSYIKTSHEVKWLDRIKIQSVLQSHIDASISSTINLAKETTVEECEELFLEAWRYGLKGVTIFRDGCKRTGILTVDEDDAKSPEVEVEISNSYSDDTKYSTCPECGDPIEVVQNACSICMNCGYSPCS